MEMVERLNKHKRLRERKRPSSARRDRVFQWHLRAVDQMRRKRHGWNEIVYTWLEMLGFSPEVHAVWERSFGADYDEIAKGI